MTTNITQKLKPNIKLEEIQQANGIFCCMNDVFISGDNQRYMKMYDWMSFVYDFAEKWIGKLKYGNTIKHLRNEFRYFMYPLVREQTCIIYQKISIYTP